MSFSPDITDKFADFAQRSEKERRRFYARKPKPMQSVMTNLMAKRGYAATDSANQLRTAWNEAVGEVFSQFSRPIGLRRGVLEVLVANSTMMQEINFNRTQFLADVQKAIQKDKTSSARITGLKLKIGRIKK